MHPSNSPKYLREVVHPAAEAGLRRSGRTRKDFTFVTSTFVIVGDTEKERSEQAQMVRQQIAFYASTRTYRPVLAIHGFEDVAGQLHRKSVEQDWAGMASLITDEMLDTYALTATYDKLDASLKQRYAGWTAYILTADLRLAKIMRLQPSRRTPLFNGALECRLFKYELVAGSMRKGAPAKPA